MGRPRKDQTRASAERKADSRPMPQANDQNNTYVPQGIEPPDMKYRWVAMTVHNEPWHGNWSARVRSGWNPVPRDRHLDIWPYIPMPGFNTDSNYIINGGLILCEKSRHLVELDKERSENETNEQMNAIAWTTTGLENTPKVNESGKATHGHAMFKADE